MKAARYHTHGSADVLNVEEVAIPSIADHEVLVKVHACGVNPGDWQIRSGLAGDAFPLPYVPGWDVSGVVEQVGLAVTTFRVGDEVFGMTANSGGCAEYAVVPVNQIARKPPSIDHIQAAAVPMSAFTAWHALFEQGNLEQDQTVLINGAAGGVGHFAVQLAKSGGATVIGVASSGKESFVRSLGADEYIDYSLNSFGLAENKVDLVLDTIGGENGHRLIEVLRHGGSLVPITWGEYASDKLERKAIELHEVQLPRMTSEHLNELTRLIENGNLRASIEEVFAIEDIRKAHERSESRRTQGKLVIRI
ncbi:NADP-dependent oxidoreductase [Cohnella cholangitidis]|uniref:NADP-dependent oxidoreductase n=1 Tax=Cohnella cholangitidis TaxID=2598458 RepID=A0A7G5C638_9BACL|nr:NADP-dependent oxidoreductase [Cohnella cholangitidis]QMV44672.1 NADP-dependent oxidoreductase [Cohnella cholangitidis]